MPLVSSLHLGCVSTRSRGLFPLPSLSSIESSPKRRLSPVLIHHGSSSCWINHHHDAWRAAILTEKSVTLILPLLCNSVSFSLASCLLSYFSPSNTHTCIHTWSNSTSLLCHALQHAWSACQETVSNFQDSTPTPWKYLNTHSATGSPAGKQVDALVQGRTGRQTVMSSGPMIRWLTAGKDCCLNVSDHVFPFSCAGFKNISSLRKNKTQYILRWRQKEKCQRGCACVSVQERNLPACVDKCSCM